MQVPQVPLRVHPVQPPRRSSSPSAIAPRRRSPSTPSSISGICGSRPTLQMLALPCGSTWKKVQPALQPVNGLR
jgi:hypothetical protein